MVVGSPTAAPAVNVQMTEVGVPPASKGATPVQVVPAPGATRDGGIEEPVTQALISVTVFPEAGSAGPAAVVALGVTVFPNASAA